MRDYDFDSRPSKPDVTGGIYVVFEYVVDTYEEVSSTLPAYALAVE